MDRDKKKAMKKKIRALTLCAMLFALCFSVEAQQPTKVYRTGILSAGAGLGITVDAFRRGMRELGYIEGQNLVIEWRFAAGNLDRLTGLAADLVHLKVDVIIVSSTQGALAAKKATQAIPIVFAVADDPVESGLVASLAQPSGNATGVTDFAGDLAGKRLELLKETLQRSRASVYLYGIQTVQEMLPSNARLNRRLGF